MSTANQVHPCVGQVWIVKTGSAKLARVKLTMEGGSRRGRWQSINLATGRQVEVNAQGFKRLVENVDGTVPAPPTKPALIAESNECVDHWHCDPVLAAHICDHPDRRNACPTCHEKPHQ